MMKKKRNCFEGWYYREQSKDLTIAFIPALHYDEEGHMTGSLQVVLPEKSWSISYDHPVNMNLKDSLFVVLGKNVFTEACIHLDIDEPGLYIKGDIYFDRDYGTKFHVMGPLRLPLISLAASRLLPCGHHIWAMEQVLSGELEIRAFGCGSVMAGGRTVDFKGGKGYLECDYGKTFPTSYFWSHCNWFEEKSLRITCAGVELSGERLGCFACIDQNGYRLKLATYRGAKIETFSPEGFRIRQGKYLLEGWKMEGKPVPLRAPLGNAMSEATDQYLECTVRYRLTRSDDVLFDEISQMAAYEFR